jgi:alkylresorcinol/alkylpyrone synthase
MIDPSILSIGTAVPDRCFPQEEILENLRPYLGDNRHADTIFKNTMIGSRYLAVDGSYYAVERKTRERNERYMQEALQLGSTAIHRALHLAGITAQEIDQFSVVSCTGIDTPGLDLQLAGLLNMSPWLKRTNILGMGCYGAFPGLLRAREAAAVQPGSYALVLSVEICSLHFQPHDSSLENIVSSALFADGAAAVLVSSRDGQTGPRLVDAATYSDYQTFDHMAFHLTDHGFRMSLSSYVPKLLSANIEVFVDTLLERNGLRRSDVQHWGVHPGSSKILDHVQQRLGLSEHALDASRRVLHQYGNMSSATVLFVLDEVQRRDRPQPGAYGMLMSFGPGLTMEGALVRWP